MQNIEKIQKPALQVLEVVSKSIAYFVCLGLLIASGMIVFRSYQFLAEGNVDLAIQGGLSVLILLEMFYVTRSFIRHGSINVSIIINVGVIAAVKEMVLKLNTIDLQIAAAFGIIFVTLSFTYFLEKTFYKKVIKPQKKAA